MPPLLRAPLLREQNEHVKLSNLSLFGLCLSDVSSFLPTVKSSPPLSLCLVFSFLVSLSLCVLSVLSDYWVSIANICSHIRLFIVAKSGIRSSTVAC